MKAIQSTLLLTLLLSLSSCSLLELSVDTGVIPLESKDLNTRIAIRAYSQDFSNQVILAADSIIQASKDKEVQSNAITWKINTTSAITQTAYQTVPEMSLIESWILATQMNNFFSDTSSFKYLKDYTPIAQTSATELQEGVSRIAQSIFRFKEYNQREEFVEQYAAEHPFTSINFIPQNVYRDYLDYLGISDTAFVSTMGSNAEVMSDMSERLSALGAQAQTQVEWQKDIFMLNNNTDSIAQSVIARMDSFAILADKMVLFAESSPEIMADFMIQFQATMYPLITDINSNMKSSIDELSAERVALQSFIDQQRSVAIEELTATGDQLIATTIDHLTLMLKQLSWLIIILAIVLTAVLFGLPFFLGYQFANMKGKIRKNKQ